MEETQMRSMLALLMSVLVVTGIPSLAKVSLGQVSLGESLSLGEPRPSPAVPHADLAGPGDVSLAGKGFWQSLAVPVNVSQCPTNRAIYPTIGVAAGGHTIYLAWTDGRALAKDIYYAASTDGGWHWADPRPVIATAADSWRPSLVVSGSTPVLAWAESLSGMNRATYQMELGAVSPLIVPNERSVLAYAPRLASGPGGELHLALQGGLGTEPDILYSRRMVGATGWPTATLVFSHTDSGSYHPAIAVSADGQTVHLVWQENRGGDESDIKYLRGQWSGEEILWGTPASLSEAITQSVRPAIALESSSETGQTVYVAWGEKEAGYGVQYVRFSRSDDGGVHWSTPSRVDPEPVSANNVAPTDVAPALAVAPSGAVCLAWHGFRASATIEAEEVHLTCSDDRGDHWGAPVNVSRSPDVISIRPLLAIGSNGVLHVAWQELAGGNPITDYQIYYARSLPYLVMLPIVMR
jgi:hypothetical protein